MSLAAFQDAFTKALLNVDISDDELESIPNLPPSPILKKQFNLYRENFLKGLHDILLSAYPTVNKIMGDGPFLSASNAFFMQHPPKNVDPILICEKFATFTEKMEISKEFPYLADIATIDLGCFQSKQAIDATPIEQSSFTELPPEQLASRKIQLHPACFWISSPFAIYDIWQQHQSDLAPQNIKLDTPQDLIILRAEPNIRVYKANPGLVKTLDALDSGEALNSALQKGSAIYPPLNAAATIEFLVTNNLITSLY